MVAAAIQTIFAQPDAEHVHPQLDEVADTLAARLPGGRAAPRSTRRPTSLAFALFPIAHWTKIWSTNPLERVNAEIKRRTNVVGIFPNDASVMRLVTAVLVEQHDEWEVAERRYLSEESMGLIDQPVADELAWRGCPWRSTREKLSVGHSSVTPLRLRLRTPPSLLASSSPRHGDPKEPRYANLA